MNKVLLIMMLVLSFSQIGMGQTKNDNKENPNGPKIVFNKTVHDFNELQQNSPALCEFKFYNKGKAPLIVSNVSASCGCTVPSWSKEPVMPGDSGIVQVKYSTAAPGAIDKLVTVYSNATQLTISLQLKGRVVKKLKKD